MHERRLTLHVKRIRAVAAWRMSEYIAGFTGTVWGDPPEVRKVG
jgi:hypothetical protein